MAQKTFVSEILTASDVNLYLAGEGGAWTSWSPVVTQNVNVTITNTRSRLARYGRTIHFQIDVEVTGTGTGANDIFVSLPVTAASSSVVMGTGWIFDSSSGIAYAGPVQTTTTNVMKVLATGTGGGFYGSQTMTVGLASVDIIRLTGTYEAAT